MCHMCRVKGAPLYCSVCGQVVGTFVNADEERLAYPHKRFGEDIERAQKDAQEHGEDLNHGGWTYFWGMIECDGSSKPAIKEDAP